MARQSRQRGALAGGGVVISSKSSAGTHLLERGATNDNQTMKLPEVMLLDMRLDMCLVVLWAGMRAKCLENVSFEYVCLPLLAVSWARMLANF